MKNTITTFIFLLLVAGCSKHESQQQTQTGQSETVGQSTTISNGMDQKSVLDQLAKEHLTILKESPELIRVQWTTNQTIKSPLMEFHFVDGRLTLTTFTNINSLNP
jgi:Flp pilus assembly protein TadD